MSMLEFLLLIDVANNFPGLLSRWNFGIFPIIFGYRVSIFRLMRLAILRYQFL